MDEWLISYCFLQVFTISYLIGSSNTNTRYLHRHAILCKKRGLSMIKPFLFIILTMFFTLSPLSADDSNVTDIDDVKKSIYQALSAINSYTLTERDKTLKGLHKLLDDIDLEIEQMHSMLKDESDELSQSAKNAWEKRLPELQKQRDRLAIWYKDLKESSSSSWEKYKEAFSKAYDDFNQTYHRQKESEEEIDTSKKSFYI